MQCEVLTHLGFCEDEGAGAGRRGARKPQLERVYHGDACLQADLACLTTLLQLNSDTAIIW